MTQLALIPAPEAAPAPAPARCAGGAAPALCPWMRAHVDRAVFRWQELESITTGATRKVLVVGRGALQRVVRRCPVCSGSPNGSDPGDAHL